MMNNSNQLYKNTLEDIESEGLYKKERIITTPQSVNIKTTNGKGQILLPKLKNISKDGEVGKMELEVIAEDAYFQPYEETFKVVSSKKAKVEVLSKTTSQPKIVVEKVMPETPLIEMFKENKITRKMLIKNKSRFSKVLHNYYKEANIREGFNEFLSPFAKYVIICS